MEEIIDDFSVEDINQQVASKGTRLANFLLDSFIVGLPISLATNYLFYGTVVRSDFEPIGLTAAFAEFFMRYGLFLVYYILMEYYTGKTIGKMITNTKVVTAHGDTPTLGKVIGRSFARYIPFEPFSFIGSRSKGWHDSMTDTYVIQN